MENSYNKLNICLFNQNQFDQLSKYLFALSDETKNRFGPHGYDIESIRHLYNSDEKYTGYIAQCAEKDDIIAYSIIKHGYLEHDAERLRSLGIMPDMTKDVTFAPSVADAWQGQGIGRKMFYHICNDLKAQGVRRIILWGGVQASNAKALKFYENAGFITLGSFWHNGDNFDMVKDL